jgi:cyanate permease
MEREHQSPYRFVIEGILFLTYAFFGATWASAGSLLKDIMQELHLDLGRAGFLSTAVSFAKIFGPAIAGFLSLKLGLRWALALASGLVCFGILAPFAPDFSTLLIARFLMGLGGAMVVVYFTPMVIAWFPPKERTVVNGLNFIAINAGMGLALTVTPTVQQMTGGWKGTLLAYSLVNVALFLAWLLFGRGAGEKAPRRNDASDDGFMRVASGAVRDANLWKLVFTYSGVLSFYLVLFTYFPTYYRETFTGPCASLVQKAPAIAMWAGIPAAILGIWLTRRWGLRTPFLKVSGVVLLAAVPGLFLTQNPVVVIASAVVTGFALFLWASPFFTIPTELPGMTASRSSAFMGIFWAACYIVATFLVWLTGKIASSGAGYLTAFVIIGLAAGTLLAGSLLLPETGQGMKAEVAAGRKRVSVPSGVAPVLK